MPPFVVSLWDWLIWIIVGLFLIPFFAPIATSIVVARMLRMDGRAFLWGVLFGVLAVPMVWVSDWLGGWYAWIVSIAATIAGTALFLWWRARYSRAST